MTIEYHTFDTRTGTDPVNHRSLPEGAEEVARPTLIETEPDPPKDRTTITIPITVSEKAKEGLVTFAITAGVLFLIIGLVTVAWWLMQANSVLLVVYVVLLASTMAGLWSYLDA